MRWYLREGAEAKFCIGISCSRVITCPWINQNETQEGPKTPNKTRSEALRVRSTEEVDSESGEEGDLVCRLLQPHRFGSGVTDLNPDAELFTPGGDRSSGEQGWRDAGEDITDTPAADCMDGLAEPGVSVADPEESQGSSEETGSEGNSPAQPAETHPRRERRRPKRLTYQAMGELTVIEVGAKDLRVSTSSAYNGLWRPWAVEVRA